MQLQINDKKKKINKEAQIYHMINTHIFAISIHTQEDRQLEIQVSDLAAFPRVRKEQSRIPTYTHTHTL